MSIKAMTLVGERSRAKGSNLAMLRSIADYAKDDGRYAWPSPGRLAFDQRLSRRGAELILRKLVEEGEISPEWSAANRRLYLHVRCVCDWAAYQTEGPIPLREKISRNVKVTFARKLVAIAQVRANGRAAYAKNPASSDPASITDPLEPSIEPPPAAAADGPVADLVSGTGVFDDEVDIAVLVELWNELTGDPIPAVLHVLPERRRLIRARLDEFPLETHRSAITRIAASAFCSGENPRGFVASFDWYIRKPDALVKALEGNYDDHFSDSELRAAQQHQFRTGGCPHSPRCADWRKCVRPLALKLRVRQKAS